MEMDCLGDSFHDWMNALVASTTIRFSLPVSFPPALVSITQKLLEQESSLSSLKQPPNKVFPSPLTSLSYHGIWKEALHP
jgi:hypothetical protein